MRIIAGAKRGMKLYSPKTQDSRPILDRVKESLFNILCNKYGLPAGKTVADLFCGVGSLGLEALSRGAEYVTFVENDPKVIAVLQKNIEKAGFVKESKVIRADAFTSPLGGAGFKVGAAGSERRCDLIFVDPPYADTTQTAEASALGKLLILLGEQATEDGIVTVRTNKRTKLLERYGRLETIERRQWGTMAITILRKKSASPLRGGRDLAIACGNGG